MNKNFTFLCSVESKLSSKIVCYNSSSEMIKEVLEKTSQLLDSVKLSPTKEVINKILKYADN